MFPTRRRYCIRLSSSEKNPEDAMPIPFPPFSTLDYVKRVVGLPGDKIKVISNTVYQRQTSAKEDKEVTPLSTIDATTTKPVFTRSL